MSIPEDPGSHPDRPLPDWGNDTYEKERGRELALPTSGFAIASLTFGIIGGILLSVIFGFVALRQIKRGEKKGKRLAISGLVLSGLWIGGGVLAFALVSAGQADRDDSGEVVKAGNVGVSDLRAGDCIPDIEESLEVTVVRVVPCADSHDAEVFGLFDLPAGPLPTPAEMDGQAVTGCDDLLFEYSETAYFDSTIEIWYFYPTSDSWERNDREITCVARATEGPLTQSISAD